MKLLEKSRVDVLDGMLFLINHVFNSRIMNFTIYTHEEYQVSIAMKEDFRARIDDLRHLLMKWTIEE
jgi:hypothetical protein